MGSSVFITSLNESGAEARRPCRSWACRFQWAVVVLLQHRTILQIHWALPIHPPRAAGSPTHGLRWSATGQCRHSATVWVPSGPQDSTSVHQRGRVDVLQSLRGVLGIPAGPPNQPCPSGACRANTKSSGTSWDVNIKQVVVHVNVPESWPYFPAWVYRRGRPHTVSISMDAWAGRPPRVVSCSWSLRPQGRGGSLGTGAMISCTGQHNPMVWCLVMWWTTPKRNPPWSAASRSVLPYDQVLKAFTNPLFLLLDADEEVCFLSACFPRFKLSIEDLPNFARWLFPFSHPHARS